MAARGNKSTPTLGFLTVVEDPQHGAFGGFLVLSTAGRPLEFHCTTPVKPNRAQEILYGRALRPYLYGELIAPALATKAAAEISVLCVELPEVLGVRQHVQMPTVLVAGETATAAAAASENSTTRRIDTPHSSVTGLHWFEVGNRRLATAQQYLGDQQQASVHLLALTEFDLAEPFGRIRDAIEEAQRGSR